MHTPWPLVFASGNSFLEIEMRCGKAVLPSAGKAVGSRLQKFTESVNFCKCKGYSKPAFPEPRRDLAVGFEGRKNGFPEAFFLLDEDALVVEQISDMSPLCPHSTRWLSGERLARNSPTPR